MIIWFTGDSTLLLMNLIWLFKTIIIGYLEYQISFRCSITCWYKFLAKPYTKHLGIIYALNLANRYQVLPFTTDNIREHYCQCSSDELRSKNEEICLKLKKMFTSSSRDMLFIFLNFRYISAPLGPTKLSNSDCCFETSRCSRCTDCSSTASTVSLIVRVR